MEEPNCQTPIRIMTYSAVLGFPMSDVFCVIPKTPSSVMITPLFPKICFHTTDTAILPPIMEGI